MKLKQKNELRKKALIARKLEQSKKVDELAKSWNPLPERGKSLPRINKEFSTNSNFINCSQQCMNKGKYQGIDIKDVPIWYLNWVVNNIQLNQSELNLIKKRIK